MAVKFVLFDMDGILLDTEQVYTKVTSEILMRYGKTFDWSLKIHMMGKSRHDAGEFLVSTTGIPMTVEEYLTERELGHAKLFPHCSLLPGVARLVSHLKTHNIPMAVATSSYMDAFLIKTAKHPDLFRLFDGNIICGDDPRVLRGKPSPDIFLEAAKLLGATSAAECLVFEDSEPGMRAGLAAGMTVVAIPDPQMELSPDIQARVHHLQSMEHFEPQQFGLPPFPLPN
ncbi:Pseudouridine-5'-phosphatase [Kappamyces sp. JEL0680]|nr:Pseudouridine-5'-phosphatase [Kappamyces sp. JEL0680]